MTAHGMTGEIYPLGIGIKFFCGNLQYFEGIEPAPVFPVKTTGTAIGGSNDGAPVLVLVGPCLADGFHGGTMHREKQGRIFFACCFVVLPNNIAGCHPFR